MMYCYIKLLVGLFGHLLWVFVMYQTRKSALTRSEKSREYSIALTSELALRPSNLSWPE